MQIVWDSIAVEQLRKTQTVLELESFQIEDREITTYCVVPAEKILLELPQLDSNIKLHEGFVQALKENNHKLCKDIAEHLLGKFGGELDSFYQEILSRPQK
jgi:DNA polymerase III delta subunit